MAKRSEDKPTKTTAKSSKNLAPKEANAVKQTEAKVTARRGFRTLVIWLAVILAIAGISWLTHQEPARDLSAAKNLSDRVIADLQSGDCSEVYADTTDGFKARSTEENWNQQCAIASNVLQGEPELRETKNDNTEDNAVQYIYGIKGTDDQTYIVTTLMKENDDVWQLDGLSSQVERPAGSDSEQQE